MPKRLLLPLVILGSLLLAAPAQAAFRVGIGDQDPAMFTEKRWKDLKLKTVRYVVPWNSAKDPDQLAQDTRYLEAARTAKQDVLVHFTARRGCFDDGKYSRRSVCRAPSVKAYTSAVKAFRKEFPFVKTYGAWNEANHVSQPVYRNPKRAAQYFLALRAACKGCKIVAGDLLDSGNLNKYARTMLRYTKNRARIWGLHNYGDVNRKRSRGISTLLKLVPGEVWLTETGGIVSFDAARGFKPSETAASRAISYMFTLANRFDSRRKGYKSRITRLYPYEFRTKLADARFDAGLISPEGKSRKGYSTFKSKVRRAKK